MKAHTSHLRVRYSETDKMGVAYHANYFSWFEVGRCELLRSLGCAYVELEAKGIMLPVIEANCEYLRSVRYDDEIYVVTTGDILSPVRVKFQYNLTTPKNNLIATGRTTHAAVSISGRAKRLPEEIRVIFS